MNSSGEAVDDAAAGIETGREQLAAEAASAVERGGVSPLDEAGMPAVKAADDAAEAAIRLAHLEKAGAAAPPESILLGVERPRRIDPGMDEEQPVLGRGGAAQRRHVLPIAAAGIERRPQR